MSQHDTLRDKLLKNTCLQVFVDEFTCIGCRNCTNVCDKTFQLEDEYGRARVISQRGASPDTKQEAIDTCPVSDPRW